MKHIRTAVLVLATLSLISCSLHSDDTFIENDAPPVKQEENTNTPQKAIGRTVLAQEVIDKIKYCINIQLQDMDTHRFTAALTHSIGISFTELDDDELYSRGIDYLIEAELQYEFIRLLEQEQVRCSAFLNNRVIIERAHQ